MLAPAAWQVLVKEERHLCLLPPCPRAHLLVPLWLVCSTHPFLPLNGPWSLVPPLPLYLGPLLAPHFLLLSPLFVFMALNHPLHAPLCPHFCPLPLHHLTRNHLCPVRVTIHLFLWLFPPLFLFLCLLLHFHLYPSLLPPQLLP